MVREWTVAVKGQEYRVIRGRAVHVGLVSSRSCAGAWHRVADGQCDCEGYRYRGQCAHLLALAASAQVEALAAYQEERERLAQEAQALAERLARVREAEAAARADLQALAEAPARAARSASPARPAQPAQAARVPQAALAS
jgi:hypothetical protein